MKQARQREVGRRNPKERERDASRERASMPRADNIRVRGEEGQKRIPDHAPTGARG